MSFAPRGAASIAPGAAGRFAAGALILCAWAFACLACGAAAILATQRFGATAAPGACIAIALVLVTLRRPEVGIGAWFVMIPLGALGLLLDPHWLLASAWAAFVLVVALAHRPHAAAAAPASVRERLPPLGAAMLLLTAVTVAQALLGPDLSTALPSVRTIVTGAVVFFAIALTVRTRAQVMWVLGGLALAALVAGGAAIYEDRAGQTSYGFITATGVLVPRVTAGFGQPNQLGGFLVILVPLAIAGALLSDRRRLTYAAAVVVASAGVYLTYSRAALIALASVPFVFLGARRALLAAPLAAGLAVLLSPALLRERFATLGRSGEDLATRGDIWQTAERIWTANPVFGVGPGQFADAYASAPIPGKEFLPSTLFQPPPHAHNLVLQVLAEQGVVGLACLGIVLWLAVAGLLRVRRDAQRWLGIVATGLLAAFLALLAHNLFDVTLIEGTGEFVWALLGLASALIVIGRADARARGA